MNGFAKTLLTMFLALAPLAATDVPTFESRHANENAPLTLDPSSPFWRQSPTISIEKDTFGKVVPGLRTEVHTRWTKDNLYFLFVCPYKELNLKPNPDTRHETNQLWNWDVAEVFIGSDFNEIRHYKEFEVSPQGEWVDLDIDLSKPHHEEGWTWNSGFEALAKIDPQKHLWYAAMRIPFAAIDSRPPVPGSTLRINLFRSGGPPGATYSMNWQPTMSKTFHTPEKFGLIKLIE